MFPLYFIGAFFRHVRIVIWTKYNACRLWQSDTLRKWGTCHCVAYFEPEYGDAYCARCGRHLERPYDDAIIEKANSNK